MDFVLKFTVYFKYMNERAALWHELAGSTVAIPCPHRKSMRNNACAVFHRVSEFSLYMYASVSTGTNRTPRIRRLNICLYSIKKFSAILLILRTLSNYSALTARMESTEVMKLYILNLSPYAFYNPHVSSTSFNVFPSLSRNDTTDCRWTVTIQHALSSSEIQVRE